MGKNKPLEKPCPFCGSEAYVHRWDNKANGKVQYYVECSFCKIRTGYFKSPEPAVGTWNAGQNTDDMFEEIKEWVDEWTDYFCGIEDIHYDDEIAYNVRSAGKQMWQEFEEKFF